MAGGSYNADHPGYPFLEKLFFGKRSVVLLVFAIITVLLGIAASQLQIDAGFRKQLPLQHPYMQTFTEYEKEFGGTNRILIAVMMKNGADGKPVGDMFNKEFLTALEGVSEDVSKVSDVNGMGVDQSRTRSIFTPNQRYMIVTEEGFEADNVWPAGKFPEPFPSMSSGFDPTPFQYSILKRNIELSGIVGRLVAKDYSGAMVQAELVPEERQELQNGKLVTTARLNYQQIAKKLEEIRTKYEKNNIEVRIIGFTKIVDDIAKGAKSVVMFFVITVFFTWLLLFAYSTSAKLATLTVLAAFVAVIWMLGVLKLLGFGIDPLNILTPFLIFAIGVSHGEQMINRFRGQIFFGGLEEGTSEELAQRQGVSSYEGAIRAFRSLLVPGAVALIAGCIGFAAILQIPIRIIFELAVTATIGVGIIMFTNLILLPVLLSYTKLSNLDRKRQYRLRQLTKFDRIWEFLAKFSKPILAACIIAVGLVIFFFAKQYGHRMLIGDAQEGVAELFPDSRYNRDAKVITSKFALGIDILNIIAEVQPNACAESYKAMETFDRFAWHIRNVPGVTKVVTLPDVGKQVWAANNFGSLRWRTLPRQPANMATAFRNVETDTGLLNETTCTAMPMMVFLDDHKATTIDRVVAAVNKFTADNKVSDINFKVQLDKAKAAFSASQNGGPEFAPNDAVNFRLATGNVGVMAATNDEVKKVEKRIMYMVYAAVFIMCLISFRSPLAALCITLPLIFVTALGEALMVKLGIGLKVNTLTVVALGVGIGVDYAIYIYARMNELMQQGKSLTQSYFEALKTTGIAIFYTALTLACGVATWIFSDLKFQADMGLMLTFMFVVNMIAAMIFLPALCRWFMRPFEKN
jgi:uncharacterized protein